MAEEKFEYSVATENDRQEILDYLVKHFYTEEPLCRAAGTSKEAFLRVATSIVDACLKDPFSTIVRCKESGDLAAVLLISVFKRTDGKHDIGFISGPDSPTGALGRILNELHNSFFELVPNNVKQVLHREMSSVGKPYQRQGIATKMMNFTLSRDKLQKYDIDGIMSETSSLANQQLLAKHGFKPLKEIRLEDVTDSRGRPLLQPDDGTTKAVLNWMPISELKV